MFVLRYLNVLFFVLPFIYINSILVYGQEKKMETSYTAVIEEPFDKVMTQDKAQKAEVMKRHMDLLNERYDLSEKTTKEVAMSGGKPLPVGPTARLKGKLTWEKLASMTPEEVKEKNLFPYLPLPHPNHATGGMLFSQKQIKEVSRLERFDMDFDLPDHFLPEFPSPIYLTTHKDMGDVSQGKLVTLDNYYEIFNGILNPKQLEGLRLLVTQFPQQQFNATADRKTEKPSQGVTCFDCHINGHTSAATHLVGDIRPQSHRNRIDTPSLRGVNVQRLFGSQRALKSVEDFTEFEQRAAYFDGDHLTAAKKGINVLERGSQVHFMAEFMALLDFPPAPKLTIYGQLDTKKATDSEKRGEAIFFGKGNCAVCHPAPYYTDNQMHDLQVERFYKPQLINGQYIHAEGLIKTFTLRGIKDSPPYLHDGRLLTLEDTVEFFNLVLQINMNAQEKKDLVSFLRQL
ncbi:MAG TPA: cytochrome B6 [Candidatus Wujingus californicus]|uniref:cytochrome B6 n=3 Tax=Candidatus Wujingus californicus TaxID=3367618 RepID=UPI001DB8595C|nr:cytochrome B6 [Planctomycetota bacterium]MDO8130698.1 cytochrome B6 [Candidatus Brocadiales bacterium]